MGWDRWNCPGVKKQIAFPKTSSCLKSYPRYVSAYVSGRGKFGGLPGAGARSRLDFLVGSLFNQGVKLKPIPGERWIDVPAFPSYMVSDHGRFLRNTLSGQKQLTGKKDRLGYVSVGLMRNGKQVWFLAHRLIAVAFLNPSHLTTTDGSFLTVNHKNRIKSDNRLDNLELVTVTDNHRHWRKFPLETMLKKDALCVGAYVSRAVKLRGPPGVGPPSPLDF